MAMAAFKSAEVEVEIAQPPVIPPATSVWSKEVSSGSADGRVGVDED